MDHEPQARGMFWAMGTIYSSLSQLSTQHTCRAPYPICNQQPAHLCTCLCPTTTATISKGTNSKHTRQVRSTNHEPY